MIISGLEIARSVREGLITLDPFDARQINPNSYNYRLGTTLKVVTNSVVDAAVEPMTRTFDIPETGMVLRPGCVYLGHTYERIGSSCLVPSLIGRSSLGRLGVFLQISADLGQLGAVHRWTLELTVAQPIRLYPMMIIGQVSFWVPTGDISVYRGRLGRLSMPSLPDPRSMGFERDTVQSKSRREHEQ